MSHWADRKFLKPTLEESEQSNAEALGSVAVLKDLIELTNEDIEDFYHERNQEYVRHLPKGK